MLKGASKDYLLYAIGDTLPCFLSAKYIIRTHGKYYEQHYNKYVVCNQNDSYLLLL